MPKTGVFTIKGPYEGKTMVVLERYPFTNGVFKTPAHYAPLMARILCEYHGCELTYEGGDEDEALKESDGDGSLAVSSTKGGLTVGQAMEEKAMSEKLAIAKADQVKEAAMVEQRANERAALDAATPAKA